MRLEDLGNDTAISMQQQRCKAVQQQRRKNVRNTKIMTMLDHAAVMLQNCATTTLQKRAKFAAGILLHEHAMDLQAAAPCFLLSEQELRPKQRICKLQHRVLSAF